MRNIDLRNELEDYGDHLPVAIEDGNGQRFKIAAVETANTTAGVVIVLATTEEAVDDPDAFFEN